MPGQRQRLDKGEAKFIQSRVKPDASFTARVPQFIDPVTSKSLMYFYTSFYVQREFGHNEVE